MNMSNVLSFHTRKNMDKKTNAKSKQSEQAEEVEQTKRDETPLKKSIVLPAYVWDVLESDSKRQRRTMAKQIEVILVDHYALDPQKIDTDKNSPNTFGWVAHKASLRK